MAAHAKLGASSAHRWMVCPGSVVLSEGIPDVGSVYAREGSAAHALAEHCLLNNEAPFEYLDETHPDPDYADIPIGVDMVDAVTIYVNHIKSYGIPPSDANIELQVSLDVLGDWASDMFGTADFNAVDRAVLLVDDYKHGMGEAVEVDHNAQCKYYALGAYATLNDAQKKEVQQIRTTIIQPRKPHEDGPIRTALYTPGELLIWGDKELRPAVDMVDEATAAFGKQDDWADEYLNADDDKACTFCRAKGKCPALAKKAMDIASLDFDDAGSLVTTKSLDELTPEQIAGIIDGEKVVQKWLSGVNELATESLKRGVDLTGGRYKLVAGRSSRDWRNESGARTWLEAQGLGHDDLFTEKFVTPAQAEKLVGKDGREDLAGYIKKSEGKPTLAPMDDKRPALEVNPESDFDGVG